VKKSLSTEKFSILYFDGNCNLCNGWVDFLISRDHQGKIKFASLQSEFAKKNLPKEYTENLHTLVFVKDGVVNFKSNAAIRVLAELGGAWPLVKIFLLVPLCVRNFLYRFVARNRYKWFGRRETCRLPTPQERDRFLV
jgi:predicted DCC family thiol-disulfide oxidoreductase YuxK